MYDGAGSANNLRAANWRKRYVQNRFSYRGCDVGRGSALVAGTCKSREWSNRRRRRRGTYRWSAVRRRPGVTACSAPGLLCAGTGLCRRACLPSCSRAVLGRVRLGIPASPGLQLIAGSQRPQFEVATAPCSALSERPVDAIGYTTGLKAVGIISPRCFLYPRRIRTFLLHARQIPTLADLASSSAANNSARALGAARVPHFST